MSGDSAAGITLLRDEQGSLAVVGSQSEVAGYVERTRSLLHELGDASPISVQDLADVAAGVSALGALGANAGSILTLTPGSLQLLDTYGRIPDGAGAFHTFVTGPNGRIAAQLRFTEVPQLGSQMLSVQMAAATSSLRHAIKDVQESIERVEDKVDAIAQQVEAQLVGSVVSQYEFLDRWTDATHLTDTDWQSISPLGQPVHSSTEVLRQYLRRMVDAIPVEANARDRARKLTALVERDRVPETLTLLLVAQQAEYLWQSLRLQRVADVEPQHLDATIESARTLLQDNLTADRELVEELAQRLVDARSLRPLEIHRKVSGSRLSTNAEVLRAALDRFSESRQLQAISWAEPVAPTFSAAWKELHLQTDVRRLQLGQARASAIVALTEITASARAKGRDLHTELRERRADRPVPGLFRSPDDESRD